MALSLADKKAVVAEVAEVASDALSIVAAEYRGLTVSQMDKLRSDARSSGVKLRVIRNTLAKRAFKNTEFECMQDAFIGPLFVAFSMDAPGAAARVLRDFAKEHEQLIVKAIGINGKVLDASQLSVVASLPNREEALAKLLFVMKEPVAKLARTMQETYGKMVRTVAAIRDQKQAS